MLREVVIADHKADKLTIVGLDPGFNDGVDDKPAIMLTAINYREGEQFDVIVLMYPLENAKRLGWAILEAANSLEE
jgi:hypothetical protein